MMLRLMLSQQEGHDNSGFAMVMQDLEGIFAPYKDKPLLSLACTDKGTQLVGDYLDKKGFIQVFQWKPDLNLRPGLTIEAMPAYIFRNYDYPVSVRNAGREAR